MRPRRLLPRLQAGDLANVGFRDLLRLLEALGFELVRTRGSHHIYRHPAAPGLLNFQEVGGQAKPYQIRQLLRTITEYELRLEERP